MECERLCQCVEVVSDPLYLRTSPYHRTLPGMTAICFTLQSLQ